MCGKKTRDVEKAMSRSCEIQIDDLNTELEKRWKEENERREKELKEEHEATLAEQSEELTGQKEKAEDDMKAEQEGKCENNMEL